MGLPAIVFTKICIPSRRRNTMCSVDSFWTLSIHLAQLPILTVTRQGRHLPRLPSSPWDLNRQPRVTPRPVCRRPGCLQPPETNGHVLHFLDDSQRLIIFLPSVAVFRNFRVHQDQGRFCCRSGGLSSLSLAMLSLEKCTPCL